MTPAVLAASALCCALTCAAALPLLHNIYCADPDDGSLHNVNTTWSSATSCSNYTCRIRRKDDPPPTTNFLVEVPESPNVEEKPYCFDEKEMKAITEMLSNVRQCDAGTVLEMYKIAKEILSDIEDLSIGFDSPTGPADVKYPEGLSVGVDSLNSLPERQFPDVAVVPNPVSIGIPMANMPVPVGSAYFSGVITNSMELQANAGMELPMAADQEAFYGANTVYKPRYNTQKSYMHIRKPYKRRVYGSLIKYPAYFAKTFRDFDYNPPEHIARSIQQYPVYSGFFYPWVKIALPQKNTPTLPKEERVRVDKPVESPKLGGNIDVNVHRNILSPWMTVGQRSINHQVPMRLEDKALARRSADAAGPASGLDQYEIYLEVTTCDTGVEGEPAYYTVGDTNKPFPLCCPLRIERTTELH